MQVLCGHLLTPCAYENHVLSCGYGGVVDMYVSYYFSLNLLQGSANVGDFVEHNKIFAAIFLFLFVFALSVAFNAL